MKSVSFTRAILTATCSASLAYAQAKPTPSAPVETPSLGKETSQGCYSSAGELVKNGMIEFNTKGACAKSKCNLGGFTVAGLSGGNLCYCGNKYPPESSRVDDSKCNIPCPGYGSEACGGIKYWTIYNTGLVLAVDNSEDKTAPSSSAPPAPSTPVTAGPVSTAASGETIVVTAPGQPSENKANIGGIAAGVVAGVVLMGVALGGLFFIFRRRRNREIEDEHRRNAAINSFVGGKGSSSSSFTDARLDPVLAQRRASDGSIADNEDYSRRILRVTNA